MRLFSMNLSQTRARLVKAGAAFAAAALVAGCGSQYRPVVTPINPSGPPAQPNSLAVVVSSSSLTTPGIATIIDYSGDTIMATAPIGPGPTSFTLDGPGSTGYTVNSDRTVTNFPASTNLQEKNVLVTTLPTTAQSRGYFPRRLDFGPSISAPWRATCAPAQSTYSQDLPRPSSSRFQWRPRR